MPTQLCLPLPLIRSWCHNLFPLYSSLSPGVLDPAAVFEELKEKRNELEKVRRSPGSTWGMSSQKGGMGWLSFPSREPPLEPDPLLP